MNTNTELKRTIQQVPIFSGLDDAVLSALVERATIRTIAKHTVVINEGEEGNALYIISSGKVRICLNDDEGKEVSLGTEGAGQYFGEYALLDRAKRSASVIAEQKCVFVIISSDDFNAWLDDYPVASFAIMKELVHKIRDLTENVKILALCDVYGRLTRVLMNMAVEQDGRLIVPVRPTQQELANRIGSSREMVSKIFKELSKGGHLEIETNRIIIHKPLPKAW
jgi:CRP/FNR family cyclic AMP-dependent transcriptional regulator